MYRAFKSIERVCIIGANFESDNLGVRALAHGSLLTLLHNYPDAEVFLLDYRREPETFRIEIDGKTVYVPILNIRFSKSLLLSNNIALLMAQALLLRVVPIRSVREKLVHRNPYLEQLQDIDLALAISGGDSFSDIYGIMRMFYVSFPQLLILLLKRPLVLLPQTIGPFKSRFARWIARRILCKAEIVYVRDEEGVEYTNKLMGARKAKGLVHFCPDVAFVMEPVQSEAASVDGSIDLLLQDTRPVVGLNVSGLLYMGGYNRKNMFGLQGDYKALIHDVVRYFIDEKNSHVVLVPHVLGEEEESQESDIHACREIFNALTKDQGQQLHLVKGTYQANEIKYLIGKFDFFLASRLHACIAALSQHIPAVGLAYSHKFDGVLKSVNVSSLVIDLRLLTNTEVMARVRQSFEDRVALKQCLDKSIPQVKRMILQINLI